MASYAPSSSSTEKDKETQGRERRQLVTTPEDGYEWKKYGQKYIVKIGKNRSYFKCRKDNCGVKKRVEWVPSDSNNIRIMYEGVHNHQPPLLMSNESTPNPYDLRNQVLGGASDVS